MSLTQETKEYALELGNPRNGEKDSSPGGKDDRVSAYLCRSKAKFRCLRCLL